MGRCKIQRGAFTFGVSHWYTPQDVPTPPHRRRGGRAQLTRAGRQLSLCRQKAFPPHCGRGGCAAQACLCSQKAVQLISSGNRPTTPTRNPTTSRHQERRTIHSIPESQGCLVLLCPGWSTTLSADGSRWTRLFMILPCTATAVLLSAAPGMPPTLASRTAWNADTATALAVRDNAGYSFTSTRTTLPNSTTASIPMHLPSPRNRLTRLATTDKACLLFVTTCATSHIPIMCASSVQHMFTPTTTASARMGLTACGKHSVHSTHMP